MKYLRIYENNVLIYDKFNSSEDKPGKILKEILKLDFSNKTFLDYNLGTYHAALQRPSCNLENAGCEAMNSPYTPQFCCDWVGEFKAFSLI